jgi:hypothetical protein
MGGAWNLRVVPAAAVCALALAACGGGGGENTTSGAEAGAESTVQAPGAGAGGTSGKEGNPSSGGEGKEAAPSSGGASATGPGPSKGERSYAFRTPGGDNSIQEYGNEGKGGERAEATSSVEALYAAFRSGNWGEVCAKYLSAKNLEQLKLLAEKSPQVQGASCADILSRLNTAAGEKSPDQPQGGVAALRIEGDTAFAIYRGVDGKGYALPLTRENGVWKLTALGPTPLQGP